MANITGTAGNDTRNGTAAADLILGLAGADVLNGLGGADTLRGGSGNDRLDGGAGTDTASWLDVTGGGITASLVTNSATGAGGSDTLVSIENLEGSHQNDSLLGNTAANTLWGSGGDDSLDGGAGDDLIYGGNGSDSLEGGAGIDTLDFSRAAAGILADLAPRFFPPIVNDGLGSDAAFGFEIVIGSAFDDFISDDIFSESSGRLVGGAGDDRLVMNAFDTTRTVLDGGEGNDSLTGYGGQATLLGGNGNDVLEGAEGDDRLVGGAGADVFLFRSYAPSGRLGGEKFLADFTRGEDRFEIEIANFNVDPFRHLDGAGLFTFLDSNGNGTLDDADDHVEVRNVTDGGVTRLSTVFDYHAGVNDGVATGNVAVVFGVTGLTASDFV